MSAASAIAGEPDRRHRVVVIGSGFGAFLNTNRGQLTITERQASTRSSIERPTHHEPAVNAA
jgi:hypothetical protein